jgi:hypothetical protein
MTTPNPACTINSGSVPADVSAGSVCNGALAVSTGADFWSISVVGCDEQNSVATIAATLSINTTSKTFSFTAPSSLGSAVILQSVVGQAGGGLGRDSNNVAQPSFTTTFKVNVKTATGGRVLAVNERFEQDSTFGWINPVNTAIRNVGSGAASTSLALTTGTINVPAAQSGAAFFACTGSLSGNVTLVFPSTSVNSWTVDFTGVTFNGHTISIQANSNTWGTTVSSSGVFALVYNGTRIYGGALAA